MSRAAPVVLRHTPYLPTLKGKRAEERANSKSACQYVVYDQRNAIARTPRVVPGTDDHNVASADPSFVPERRGHRRPPVGSFCQSV